MLAPSRCHCSVVVGAGWPLQRPASTRDGHADLAVAAVLRAISTAWSASDDADLEAGRGVPPELVAVTVTVAAETGLAVGMVTTPLALTVAPAPVTA